MVKDGTKIPKPSLELDEEAWLQMAKMAEMGLSAGAVAHEARQPLSALKMTLQLMRDGADDPASMRERLDNALTQTERLERLLSQLRSFLLPNAQARGEVDLVGLTEGVLTLLTGGLKDKNVELESEFEPDLPRVIVEKHKIEQVVFNLVGNAKDAVLESGGGRIVVSVFRGGPDNVKLVVADDGPGIGESIAERIFQPYFTTKGKDKGTGLGLYIAKRISDQHGVALELLDERARKDLGRGRLSTAFQMTFVLPTQRLTIPPPVPAARQGNKVLVVSNDREEARLIKELVEEEGLRCNAVFSGEEALSFIGEERFDLLIASMGLEDLTGLEIARLARNFNPLMPMLLLADEGGGQLENEISTLARSAVIRRPLSAVEIKDKVSALTGGRAASAASTAKNRRASGAPGPKRARGRVVPGSRRSPRVLIVETDDGVREKVEGVLKGLGCEVTALSSEEEADSRFGRNEFDILVANIAVLKSRFSRLAKDSGDAHAPAALAIMDAGGIDKTIEAIHLGANGVFFPPFEKDRVALELKRAVGWALGE